METIDHVIEKTVNYWFKDRKSDRMNRLIKMFDKWSDPLRSNLLPKNDYIYLCSEAKSVSLWTIDNIEKLIEIGYRIPELKRTHLFNQHLKMVEKMFWEGEVDDKICKEFVSLL